MQTQHGSRQGQQVARPTQRRDGSPGTDADDGALEEARRLLAELLGTYALTLAAAGADVIGQLSGGQVGLAEKAVAPGLVVMALIYAIGNVSGAHFNPAVTFAFLLRGDFPWRRVPGYWMAQLAGACLAATTLLELFGNVKHLGATLPEFGVTSSFAMELILTWLLITVILGTATRQQLIGPNAALAVGATIALDGLFALPVSGASMNPARSLGPALVSGTLANAWIYVVAPLAGASIAVATTWLMHGHQKSGEHEAAGGDGGTSA
jgi:MIP family channel proteins